MKTKLNYENDSNDSNTKLRLEETKFHNAVPDNGAKNLL